MYAIVLSEYISENNERQKMTKRLQINTDNWIIEVKKLK